MIGTSKLKAILRQLNNYCDLCKLYSEYTGENDEWLTHEEIIDALAENEYFLNSLERTRKENLPVFEFSEDEPLLQHIKLEERIGYNMRPFLTEMPVYKIGHYMESGSSDEYTVIQSIVTYITETGRILICEEWEYSQEEELLFLSRTLRSAKNIDVPCNLLTECFKRI